VIVATLVPLQATILAVVALTAPAVVLTRDPLRMTLMSGFYGWTLVMLFSVFQAPDVALSMLVVGGLAYPFVLLIAVARVRASSGEDAKEEAEK
jgi:energy-converting hydrogenase B subunit D